VEKRPYFLRNEIQHYAWGTKNREAFIPNLIKVPVESGLPYAELWMGAHPKAPSCIQLNQEQIPLDKAIRRFPEKILGQANLQKYGKNLPFLFKVLSANQALSIQVHPNKKQARLLHKSKPEHYPDENHKPEIAIALDGLTALAGFRSWTAIEMMLNEVPEIQSLVSLFFRPADIKQSNPQNLHYIFEVLMNRISADHSKMEQTLDCLENRLKNKSLELNEHETLFLSLRKIYPGPDIGLLALFFLNLIHLEPAQSIFLNAGLPHAYIRGNIVECMANSDNVVRAGLTSKYCDIETLTDIVVYNENPVPITNPDLNIQAFTYPAPAEEFQVSRIRLVPDVSVSRKTLDRPAILLCTAGRCRVRWKSEAEYLHLNIERGQSILIPAFLPEYDLMADEDCLLFEATTPLN